MKCPAVTVVTAATGSVTKNTEFKALRIDISGPMLCDAVFWWFRCFEGKNSPHLQGSCSPKRKTIGYCYSDIYPTRCKFTQFILSGKLSICFGWYIHPSSGTQTIVSTTPGICHTVTDICRYRGRVETGVECAVGGVRHPQHTQNQFQLFHNSVR
jgi:hypothetical protein